MKTQLAILIFGTSIISAAASATTIDYRHEWADDYQVHQDRLLIANRFDNGFGLSLEAKWRSSEKKAYSDIVSNGSEVEAGYQFVPFDRITLEPGFAFESSTDRSGYKPFIKAQYDFTSNFYMAARYRFEYVRITNLNLDDEKISQGDIWIGYNWDVWNFEYNGAVKRSNKYIYDRKRWDHEHDVKTSYRINESWAPYFQVGNISVRNNTDERQTRYRVGIQYYF